MNNKQRIDITKPVKLERAWLDFADLIAPGSSYRQEMRALRQGDRTETPKETEARFDRLRRREHGLKQQFISSVRDGCLFAFGCEINEAGQKHELSPLNNALFDWRLQGFTPDWDTNQLIVLDRTYIGIEFIPNMKVIQAEWPDHDFSDEVTNWSGDVGSVRLEHPDSPKPVVISEQRGPGRPNTRDQIKACIRGLRASEKFVSLPNRTRQAEEVRAKLLGEEYRYASDMANYKDDSIKRLIKHVLEEP